MPAAPLSRHPSQTACPLPQYYDIPSVSIASAAWRLMAAGVEGFKAGSWAGKPGSTPVVVFAVACAGNIQSLPSL